MKCILHRFKYRCKVEEVNGLGDVLCIYRHKKNRQAASELLTKLKDNRDLQRFLQDCQEVR